MTTNSEQATVDWIPQHLPEEVRKQILAMTQESASGSPSIECTENLIRHWCETTEDGNPLYLDEDYAKSQGFKGIVAPPAMIMSLGIPYRWPRPAVAKEGQGGNAHYRLKKLMNLPVGVVVESETEYFRFIEIGDRLYTSGRLALISPLKKTRIGEGYFWNLENLARNQRGELVSKSRLTMFAYNPGVGASADDDSTARGLSKATEDELKADQGSHPPANQQTYWADVSEGQSLPTLFMPITVTRCIFLASATRDFSPHHSNRDYAQGQVKARDMFLNTPFNTGMLSRFATDWGGPLSRVRKLRLAMKDNICAGDDLIINGAVTRKFSEGGDHLVDIDIQVSTQTGPAYKAGVVLGLPLRVSDQG